MKVIIDKLMFFMEFEGGETPDYYVGISEDPRTRLQQHKVDFENNVSVWYRASSEKSARAIEKHFLALGCDGGDGGGISPDWVYIFKKTESTDPGA